MADDRPEDGLQEGLKERPQDRPDLHDRPDDATPPDSGRARRAPPTIDLEASEVSAETRASATSVPPVSPKQEPEPAEAARPESQEEAVQPESRESEPAKAAAPVARPVSPWVIAPLSGAVAAALVIGVGWMLGWPEVQPATPPAPQVSAKAVDALNARVAGLSSKVDDVASRPVAPATDPASAARLLALESSLASLHDEIAAVRTQSEKLAADADGARSAPGEAAPAVDLSGITARLDQIERASRAQGNAIAQQSAKSADDLALRRVVVASLLDIAIRQGDPYTASLAAAKALAVNPDALKPLDGFAATGVPTAATLSRELLTLVPKLSPPAPPVDNASADLVDRLKVGASRLVRIERTDAVGNDRGAVVARVTAAALRNDSNEARRELKSLSPADRAAAQSWIDKSEARDAALAASRQFAADAMTALANTAQ
jgi:hypothetical protein